MVKNLALSAIISVHIPSEEIIEKIYDLGTVHFSDAKEDLKKIGTRIFVDGKLIGYFRDGLKLVESLNYVEMQRFILTLEYLYINLKSRELQREFM